jgi:hypothetical protein
VTAECWFTNRAACNRTFTLFAFPLWLYTVVDMIAGPNSEQRLRNDINAAMRLSASTETAYRKRSWTAVVLHVAAEQSHFAILKGICKLSETDADLIEPAFTELENQLHGLWTFCDANYRTEPFFNTAAAVSAS